MMRRGALNSGGVRGLLRVDGQVLELVQSGDERRYGPEHKALGSLNSLVDLCIDFMDYLKNAAPTVCVRVGLVLGGIVVGIKRRNVWERQKVPRHTVVIRPQLLFDFVPHPLGPVGKDEAVLPQNVAIQPLFLVGRRPHVARFWL